MNNLIGIAGVFGLTLCLIALYHFMSVFGHHGERNGTQITLENSHQHRRANQ